LNIAEIYFRELRDIHSGGSAVKETSYCGPLANLLNAVGKQITPRVQCIIHLQNEGAGITDGGLFTEDQLRRKGAVEFPEGVKPSRGVIETKSAAENVNAVANSRQIARYWQSYRQVLVTTYREFLLVTANSVGEQISAESFSLAGTEAEFWQAVQYPQSLAKEKGEQFVEYLKCVFLQSAQIALPRDVAKLLAPYARDARQVESVGAERLTGLRRVFQEALGLTFEDDCLNVKNGSAR
jgi:hypothetical protein